MTSDPHVEKVAHSATDEMGYEYAESQFDRDPMPASIPCQLRFTEDTEQDIERFHNALSVHGYSPLDTNPGRDGSGPYYDGEVLSEEDYKRIRILVFRGGLVRIYPREDQPTEEELAEIIHALSVGFKSPLEHDPIEQGAEA